MPFTSDQENAIRLITETTLDAQLDRRVRHKLLLLNTWTGVLTIGVIGFLVFLFVQLPDIAVGRLLGQIVEVQSDLQDAIKLSGVANRLATEASESARSAAERASEASGDVERAIALASSMNPEIMQEARRAADTLIGLVSSDKVAERIVAALATNPTVLRGSLHNTRFEEQGLKSASYWRSEGGGWKAVPLHIDMSVSLDRPSVAVLTAMGIVRARTTGSIHLGFVDPRTEQVLSTVSWYRTAGNDKPAAWHDNGGWAPFSLSTIVELAPGDHDFALATLRPGDTDWEFHHTQVHVLILPTATLEQEDE